jgi:predicted tellurium resistance membrane protein TerC
MELLTNPDTWIVLLTLTSLEIVLGIDNIVFISILAGKLPPEQRDRARKVGLLAAMGMRILLLLAIGWVVGLTEPLFTIGDRDVSGRDLILLGGGLFLLAKATWEIHQRLEGDEHERSAGAAAASFGSVIAQIMILDIVFSLDSVITAVGMADEIIVMIAAVVIAVLVMLVASGPVSRLIEEHPTLKMLALSFLLLIGVVLVAEGLGQHIEKGYIYFAMGFSVLVEFLNIRASRRKHPKPPVQLREPYEGRIEAAEKAG